MKGKSWMAVVAALGISAVLLFAVSAALAPMARRNAETERNKMMLRLLPGSVSFTPEAYSKGGDVISAVYKGEGGYVVETVTQGYAGEVKLMVGVSGDGTVTGVVIRGMEETWGLGGNALRNVDFLSQFLGSSGQLEVGKDIDVLTGATVTTKAITKGVNAASDFVTGADIDSGATQWEG